MFRHLLTLKTNYMIRQHKKTKSMMGARATALVFVCVALPLPPTQAADDEDLLTLGGFEKRVEEKVEERVEEQIAEDLEDTIADEISDSVAADVEDSVEESVEEAVEQVVESSIESSLEDNL